MRKTGRLVSAVMAGVLIGGAVPSAGIMAADSTVEEIAVPTDDTGDDGSGSGAEVPGSGTGQGSEEGSGTGTDPGGLSEGGSDQGSDGGEGSGTDSQAEDTGSGTDSGTEDTGSGTDSGAEGLTDEEARLKEEEENRKLNEDSKKDEEEAVADADREDEEKKAAQDAEDEALSKAEEVDEEALKKAEEEREEELEKEDEEARKKAEEEKEARESLYYLGNMGFPTVFYSGSYFVSESQRRLALNVGFKQIGKVYAMPKEGTVSIYEGRDLSSREVGTLEDGSLCFILEDGSDGWAFVESGDVRGFVSRDFIESGASVDAYVRSAGESRLLLAVQKVDPLDNSAYRYTLTTTRDVSQLMASLMSNSVSRSAVVQFAQQFIGNPHVWGGNSLTKGTDSPGFTQQVYAHFGIAIPRTSSDQAAAGEKIDVSDALPGDLIFYGQGDRINHVVLYIGGGKAVSAGSTTTGILVSNVDYSRAVSAGRYFEDEGTSGTSTQAGRLVATGRDAYNGSKEAQEAIIGVLAQAAETEWGSIGFCRSVIIAQAIMESGWCAFSSSEAGIQAADNNVLGMNADLLNSEWISPWSGAYVSRLVPQSVNGRTVYGFEDMRAYQDIESCMADYAAFMIGRHPELRGVNDVDAVIGVALKGYATDPSYQSKIKSVIEKYDLTRYDEPFVAGPDDRFVKGDDLEPELYDDGAVIPDGEGGDSSLPGGSTGGGQGGSSSRDDGIFIPEDTDEIPDGSESGGSETGYPGTGDADASDQTGDGPYPFVDDVTIPDDGQDASYPDDGGSGSGYDGQDADEPGGGGAAYDDAAYDGADYDGSDSGSTDAGSTDVGGTDFGSTDSGSESFDAADQGSANNGASDYDSAMSDIYGSSDKDAGYVSESPDYGDSISGSQAGYYMQMDDGLVFFDDPAPSEDNYEPSYSFDNFYEDIAENTPGEVYETETLPSQGGPARTDTRNYTDAEMELIWAIVAEEDDISYEGALAVISSVMNRADTNYKGFGKDALSQLTAPGQYCYDSPDSDPIYYQRRLGGNVPDFVKQAITDCLTRGVRNHSFNSFKDGGNGVRIGSNNYYNASK